MGKPKQPEKPPTNNPPDMRPFVEMAMNGADFKTRVLQSLVSHTSMPMFVVWWDDRQGWCSAVGNDLKANETVRKQVGSIIFKIAASLNLFGTTKAD
jgi:hypothetical protein